MGRNIYPNDNSSTPAQNIYVKDSGTWKPAQAIWVKQSGSWTKVWPRQADWLISGAELETTYNTGIAVFGFAFSTDGTKMYINDGGDGVYNYTYQFSLSTAWDISTASNTGLYYRTNYSTNRDFNASIFFKSDGTRVYQSYFSGYVYQNSLSTPWDISTAASSTGKLFTEQPAFTFPSSDGLSIYGIDYSGTIYNHTSSSAWSLANTVGTATSSSSAFAGYASAAFMRPTDLQIFASKYAAQSTWNLTSAKDITTASNANINYTSPGSTGGYGIWFSPDGKKMFIDDSSTGIMQFRLNN